ASRARGAQRAGEPRRAPEPRRSATPGRRARGRDATVWRGDPVSGFGDGALPMGLLFFAGLVFGLVRRKTGHRLARKQYPELATRLGLTYRPSPYQSGVGTLSGEYRGFSVIVDPDEQRRIRLRFEGSPKVDLRNYEKEGRPPHDMRMVFSR